MNIYFLAYNMLRNKGKTALKHKLKITTYNPNYIPQNWAKYIFFGSESTFETICDFCWFFAVAVARIMQAEVIPASANKKVH